MLAPHDVIVDMIMQLLSARAPHASICPSEVARSLAPDHWRDLMPQIRAIAVELAHAGTLRITQGAAEIDPDAVLAGQARGPIRLRKY